jgi:predicted nucleic acid-binding protein
MTTAIDKNVLVALWSVDNTLNSTACAALDLTQGQGRLVIVAPRRLLADFIIGAHALEHGYPLQTLDDQLSRAAFPRLPVVTI